MGNETMEKHSFCLIGQILSCKTNNEFDELGNKAGNKKGRQGQNIEKKREGQRMSRTGQAVSRDPEAQEPYITGEQ